MTLQIKDKAPELSLKITGDRDINLKDYAGKYLVLYFYPKDDTPGCTMEAKDFNELAAEFDKNNTIVIGVSKDNLPSHQKFTEKYQLSSLNLASDHNANTCEKYGVWQEKSMFGKKYMGINRSTFLINPEGYIEYIWDKVKVNGHALEVLEKIREIRA